MNGTRLDLSFMACLCSLKVSVRGILFRSCPLYPRFAKRLRSKKLSVEQIRCKRTARL